MYLIAFATLVGAPRELQGETKGNESDRYASFSSFFPHFVVGTFTNAMPNPPVVYFLHFYF